MELTSHSRELPYPHPRHCPTVEETQYSKSSIQILDNAISDLEDRLNPLLERLRFLRRKRQNHASYISPFRCLPVEILSQIVHYSLHNGVDMMTLTQVCGRFRSVVVGMSTVWNNIRLPSVTKTPSKLYSMKVCFPISAPTRCSIFESVAYLSSQLNNLTGFLRALILPHYIFLSSGQRRQQP
jgi:hypothetical protein